MSSIIKEQMRNWKILMAFFRRPHSNYEQRYLASFQLYGVQRHVSSTWNQHTCYNAKNTHTSGDDRFKTSHYQKIKVLFIKFKI